MDTSQSTATKPVNIKRRTSTNNPKTILFRKYAAKGTTCLESAINDLVARVRLDRLDYSDFLANKMKYIQPATGTKPQKRKLSLQVETNTKRVRMNHKITENSKKIRMGMNAKVKTKPKSNNVSTSELITEKDKHLNGEKRPVIFSSPRVRKPNPKFQDFITTSPIRLNSSATEKQNKEKADVPAAKLKPKLSRNVPSIAEKDPLDLMNTNATEAADVDVVRSFLPVMDPPKVLYDSDSATDTDDGPITSTVQNESSPRVDQDQEETNKTIVAKVQSQLNNVDPSQLMPPAQLTTNSSIILAPHTVTPVLISPQLVSSSPMPIIIATNIAPPVSNVSSPVKKDASGSSATPNSDVINNGSQRRQPNRSKTPLRTYSEKKNVKRNSSEGPRSSLKPPLKTYGEKKNKKSISAEPAKKKDATKYCLVESEGVSNRTKTSKTSNVDFNKLVRTLKSVKLPAANWKIRIVVSRSQTITEVTFTNKEVNERCVKFSRFFTGYIITFGKSVVKLIGAPSKISSFNDVTTLLDIVHNLTLNDPVLHYIADKDK